jgi:hypothetical protein
LFLLLYADDTVIFEESASDFQLALDAMSSYLRVMETSGKYSQN